jgi:hypothetical protein
MKRIFCLTTVAFLGLAAQSWGSPFACWNFGIHCIQPPPPSCPDCSCPCDTGFHHCSNWKSAHAQKLIDQLGSDCCCDRIRAAAKLGSRLHADFCCNPEVLNALAHALQCDACWEVRKAAAWSIAYQKARNEQGVLSLYLASKLDPHYMVRDAANDALSVLLVCRRECFTDLFKSADEMAKQLKGKYKPGSGECVDLVGACLSSCHAAPAPGPQAPPAAGPQAPLPQAPLPRGKSTSAISIQPETVTPQSEQLQIVPLPAEPNK